MKDKTVDVVSHAIAIAIVIGGMALVIFGVWKFGEWLL